MNTKVTAQQALNERRKYISAFNDTMIKIWKEQITLLGVIDTGMLLGSTHAISMKMDSNATEAELSQEFREYGLWQDYGVGLLIRLNKLSHICTASRRPTPACVSLHQTASVPRLHGSDGTHGDCTALR